MSTEPTEDDVSNILAEVDDAALDELYKDTVFMLVQWTIMCHSKQKFDKNEFIKDLSRMGQIIAHNVGARAARADAELEKEGG